MRNPIKKGQYLTKFMPLSVVNRDSKHAQTKAWKKALGESDSLPEGQIRAWGSTVEPDRDEHMILPEAAKEYLPHFLACPTFLLNHDWTGDIEQHLGSVLDITIVPNVGLDCLFEYDFDLTKTCRAVYEKTKKGSIRGYSLGFYVHDFVTLASPQEQIDALPAYARQALQDGRVWIVFTKIEIVEISAVFIPSNRGALRSSSASATQTKNERGSTMELDQVLAKMDEVSKGLTAQQERGDRLEKSVIEMADAVRSVASALKSVSERPQATLESKSCSLADLDEESLQLVTDQAVKMVLAGNVVQQ